MDRRSAPNATIEWYLSDPNIETHIVILLLADDDGSLQRYAERGKGKRWWLLAAEAARTLAAQGKEAAAVRILQRVLPILQRVLPAPAHVENADQITRVLGAVALGARQNNRNQLVALLCAHWTSTDWTGVSEWMIKSIEEDNTRLVRLAQSTSEGADLVRKIVAAQSGRYDHVLWREKLESSDAGTVTATKAAVLAYAASTNSLAPYLNVAHTWADRELSLVNIEGLVDVRFLQWITVTGDLVFKYNPAKTLDLRGATFKGNVIIGRNASLTTLDLRGMTFDKEVLVENNSALHSLDLREATFKGNVTIARNAALTTLDLRGATFKGHVTIGTNASLTTLHLGGMTFDEDVDVHTNSALQTLDLRGATFMGNVTIGRNASLTTLDLGGTTFDEAVLVQNNSALQTLFLTDMTVGGKARIAANPALHSLDLRGATFKGDVRIAMNTALTTLDLGGMTFDKEVLVQNNSALQTLVLTVHDNSALQTLFLTDMKVGGRLCIWENGALHSLDLRGATFKGDVMIERNASLTTLDLDGMTVGGRACIAANPALHSLDLRGATFKGDVRISMNAALTTLDLGGMTFDKEVLVQNNRALQTLDLRGATFKGGVKIRMNAALTTLDLGGMTFDKEVLVQNNSALQTLDLTDMTVGGRACITENRALHSLALTGMKVGGNVSIRDCALRSLALTDMTVGGNVSIRGNEVLRSVALTDMTVGGNVFIGDNEELKSVDLGDDVTIHENLCVDENAKLELLSLATGLDVAGIGVKCNATLLSLTIPVFMRDRTDIVVQNNRGLALLELSSPLKNGLITVEGNGRLPDMKLDGRHTHVRHGACSSTVSPDIVFRLVTPEDDSGVAEMEIDTEPTPAHEQRTGQL